MASSKYSANFLAIVTVLLASSAFAANSGSMTVSSPVNVSGKQLAAGEYQLKWEGTGSDVKLNILRGRDVVTTIPAKLVDLPQSASSSAIVVMKNADGSRSLSEVRFGGKKYALAVAGDAAPAATGGEGSK
jgi:hypothetical protein